MYKNCPNCGARVLSDMRFCNNCGYDFANVNDQPAGQHPQGQSPYAQSINHPSSAAQPTSLRQPTNTAPPTQQHRRQSHTSATATKTNGNYWQFLLSGLSHPLKVQVSFDRRFGLISLTLSALLAAIATAVSTDSILNSPLTVGLHSFILLLASNFIIASTAFLARWVFLGDHSQNYLTSLTTFAHHTNLMIFISILLLLWQIIDLNVSGYYFIFSIGGLFLQLSLMAMILDTTPKKKIDKGYAYLIASVIIVFAIGFVIAILGVSTLNDLIQNSSTLFT